MSAIKNAVATLGDLPTFGGAGAPKLALVPEPDPIRDVLPLAMIQAKRWLVWRSIPQAKGKPRKVPSYADGSPRGATDTPEDRAHLADYATARQAVDRGGYTGLGFALGPDGTDSFWQGIDLDGIDERPELAALAETLPGYVERSPSGKGVHAIGYGEFFPSLASKSTGPGAGIEAYAAGRYFTVTGARIGGEIADISEFVRRTLAPMRAAPDAGIRSDVGSLAPVGMVDEWSARAPDARELSPERVRDVRSALLSLRAEDRDTWIRLGLALAAHGDQGRGLWLEWGSVSDKFDAADASRTWDSLKPTSGINYRAVLTEAQAAGWVNPATHAAVVRSEIVGGEFAIERTDPAGDIFVGGVLAKRYRDRLCWLHESGETLSFLPEAGWVLSDPGAADVAAKAVVASICRKAAELAASEEARETRQAKLLMQYASKYCSIRAMRDMQSAAKSEPGMTKRMAEFDADPMLLGLPNAVLDLESFKARRIDPALLVTKRCRARLDTAATAPTWDRFLKDVLPDKDVRDFLQAFFGQMLIGRVDHQLFLFLHGLGANGKSVFIEALAHVLGDYAHRTPTETLMRQPRSAQSASPDIAGMKGRRLVFANETEEGVRFAESQLKVLTGGDTLTGRDLYSSPVTFIPSHTLVIVGNHKPVVTDDAHGLWRRVCLIDFGVTIPEERRDPTLAVKLRAESSGILNWMLLGLRRYQREGLSIPATIKAATRAYQTEMDILGEWIATCCTVAPDVLEAKTTIYLSYSTWADSNGHGQLSSSSLSRRLASRGIKVAEDKRHYRGLKVLR